MKGTGRAWTLEGEMKSFREARVVEMRWDLCGLLLLLAAERPDEACPDTQEAIRGNLAFTHKAGLWASVTWSP